MRLTLVILFAALLFAGCSKMEEKKQNQTDNTKQPPPSNMQNPHGNMQQQNQQNDKTDMAPDDAVDAKADQLVKDADNFESVYKKSGTDENKKTLIDKHMAAGKYLMYEANLSPKKKYGPALKQFRRVLELDPKNQEAMNNKLQIEDIYTSMGRPIPE